MYEQYKAKMLRWKTEVSKSRQWEDFSHLSTLLLLFWRVDVHLCERKKGSKRY
jgi:hypothetical protein